MACHYPLATGLLILVTVTTILSLTILWVDAAVDLSRWHQKYGHWVSIEAPIVGTTISIQEDFGLTHCAQITFVDVDGDETTAVLDCVLLEQDAEPNYSIGDLIKIRYNPSNPKEVASETVISSEKSKLSSTIIFGTSASMFLGLLFGCHIKRFIRLMQDEEGTAQHVREDDSTKTMDSLELASNDSDSDSDSDSQKGRRSYFVRWYM